MTDRLEPKFFSALKEGYNLSRLKADALAGLTVAIVALPLSMAIAISSGVTPERGLYTAIFGGFVVSLLGGSRFQIGGPAGAFIVLVAACVARNGVEGLILATMMSGLFLIAVGFLRLGKYIKYIPYPVTVGFTAGIGVIIFSGEIHDLFGLTTQGKEPGPLVDKLIYLSGYIGTTNAQATSIAGLTIAVILLLKRFLPNWPGLLIAVGLSSVLAATLGLNVETIGTRFGGIPDVVPLPKLPTFSLDLIVKVLPDAIAFTLLGAIESLLSAVVADGMSGRRHRSSMELIGQGVANITSGLFGGFCVTGTIARTATNVRAGATSPVSGMLHAVFLLVFLLVAAPLARYIPLAALAGVLAFVCYNMIEQQAIAALFRSSWGDAVVLSATFLVVTFRDLTEGILVGFVLGAFLFIERMAKHVQVSEQPGDLFADDSEGPEKPFRTTDPDTAVYRISGVFFFGAAATVASVLDRIADTHRNFILDCSSVPFMDSSAANVIEGAVRKAHKNGVRVLIAGASPDARAILEANHVKAPAVEYFATFKEAAAAVHLQPPRFDAATARA